MQAASPKPPISHCGGYLALAGRARRRTVRFTIYSPKNFPPDFFVLSVAT